MDGGVRKLKTTMSISSLEQRADAAAIADGFYHPEGT